MKLITRGDEGLAPLSGDITGKVVVIAHTRLNKRYQSPRFQLFKATGGFGCKEGGLGSAVFGQYLADGEDDRRERQELIGIASDELVGRALEDTTPVVELDLTARVYLLIAKDGTYEVGDTVEQTRQRLLRLTDANVTEAWSVHPESKISDIGFITYPQGAPPVAVRIKKGKEWTVAN